MLRVAIVAAEPSGDLLAAGLMRELRARLPEVSFEGIGGPLMVAEGCRTLYPMEKLSVMGLVEVLKHLPELLSIRRGLRRHLLAQRPDLFIGVDAPDFNLGLERRLKQAGIPTVHYVSPTVWAWRQGRVRTLRRCVDLMLSIFPFEVEFLRRHEVPVAYIGHPLADQVPLQVDHAAAREKLSLGDAQPVLALLPGSRVGEIEALAGVFLQAARRCRKAYPGLRCVVPLVNQRTRDAFETVRRREAPDLPLTLVDGQSQTALAAADLVLTASGTATLEALLLKRPMVVAYRLNPLTHWLVTRLRLVKVPHIAMANLLAGERIAPEFVQHQVTPATLATALLELLENPRRCRYIEQVSERLHRELRRDASARAAEAVLELLGEGA